MQIQIETFDDRLLQDLFGTTNTQSGQVIRPTRNVTIEFLDKKAKRAPFLPDVLSLLITFGTGAGSSLFATWLYDKIKGRATSLRIESTTIDILSVDEDSLTKLFASHLSAQKDN